MVIVTELPPEPVKPSLSNMTEQTLKEEGNAAFNQARFEEAIVLYSKALKATRITPQENGTLLKNRAACYLKIELYKDAVRDCTDALALVPNDPKALFRRCQAFEGLERPEDAYKDAVTLVKLDPKNKAVQPVLTRLQPLIQQKIEQQHLTGSKVTQMFNLTFKDEGVDLEKKKQAAQNLIVLAREEAGAEHMYDTGGLDMLVTLLEDPDMELRVTAVRVVACMAANSKRRALGIIEKVTLKKMFQLMAAADETLSTATANLTQAVVNSVTDIEAIKKERESHETKRASEPAAKLRPYPFVASKISKDVEPLIDEVFSAIVACLNNKHVSAAGRDNALELLVKFVTQKDGVGWQMKFIERSGMQALLEVAGAIVEHNTLPVSENSRMHASLAMSKIYNDLIQDSERTKYQEAVDNFFVDMFSDGIMESKVESVMALAALLQGPFEVGNVVLGRPGVLELILAMADSDNAMHVKYAVEALVHSTSKKDRCSAVIKQATPILKQLYQSRNEHIKVRALVGLSKLGSIGGGDASQKSFAEGSTQTLAKACRKFLKNPSKDVDLRKWAAEGLAYLSLDADVKEELVDDTDALTSLIQLAKIPDKNILYPVAQCFVNVVNAYDIKEPEPELVELAKFAKHHVPEAHAKDKEPHITARLNKLVAAGVINALVALSKSESDASKELLGRVYHAVAAIQEHRGLLVQQGGAKALIPLTQEGTPTGKIKAAQALAKIGITMNPEQAFPGQRMCEVVRPLVQLLDMERTALENFEALLALTNLASVSTTVRKRMLKEHAFSKVEFYIYEEHELLKRASLECMCNLMMEEETLRYFKGDNDRVKYLLLCSGECMDETDDLHLCRATAGGLAMISHDVDIATKITTCTTQWQDILQSLAINANSQLQHRGMHIVMNLMAASKDIADKIVESPLLEILMLFSRVDDPAIASVKVTAERCLEKAAEWGLIEPPPEGQHAPPVRQEMIQKLVASVQKKIDDAQKLKEEKDRAAEASAKQKKEAEDKVFESFQSKVEAAAEAAAQMNKGPKIVELPDDECTTDSTSGPKIVELPDEKTESNTSEDTSQDKQAVLPSELD